MTAFTELSVVVSAINRLRGALSFFM